MLTLAFFCYKPLAAQESHSIQIAGKEVNLGTMNQEILDMMDEMKIAGLSYAVIDNNEVVYYNNFGYKMMRKGKDGEVIKKGETDKETLFEACSLSKTFLLPAVYKLVDQGKLDLDRPLYQYMESKSLQHDDRYKLITARMVLSHNSGLENWKSDNDSEVLEIMTEPGEAYVYSGSGYNYLSKVIETISGKSTEEYIDELVYQPLNLERTFTTYQPDSLSNYAYGHTSYGQPVKKTAVGRAVMSSYINTTAQDYAKVVASLFDGSAISNDRVKDIISPNSKIADAWPNLYYGAGFEILYTPTDTMIFQGGDNFGFKGQLCYSVTNKRGIVMLSNSDRGKFTTKKLCQLAFGDEFDSYFNGDFFTQYPSKSISLFSKYLDEGIDVMMQEFDEMLKNGSPGIGQLEMQELGYYLVNRELDAAEKITSLLLEKYPNSSFAHYQQAGIDFRHEDYKAAYASLVKAKELNFPDQLAIDGAIKDCQSKMQESGTINP